MLFRVVTHKCVGGVNRKNIEYEKTDTVRKKGDRVKVQ